MGRMVYNVTKAPIGWSLFRDRDRIGAYASREAALEAATAAGADAGIVTACKSTCPDQSSMKSKSRYRGLTVGSLTYDSYEPSDADLLQTGRAFARSVTNLLSNFVRFWSCTYPVLTTYRLYCSDG